MKQAKETIVVTPVPTDMSGKTQAPPKPMAKLPAAPTLISGAGSLGEVGKQAAAAATASAQTAAPDGKPKSQVVTNSDNLTLTQALSLRSGMTDSPAVQVRRGSVLLQPQGSDLLNSVGVVVRELQRQGQSDRDLLKSTITVYTSHVQDLMEEQRLFCSSLSEERGLFAKQHSDLTGAILAAQAIQSKTIDELVKLTAESQQLAKLSIASTSKSVEDEHRRALELLKTVAPASKPQGNQ